MALVAVSAGSESRSSSLHETIEEFLGELACWRTRSAYRRRLEEAFAGMGILELEQFGVDSYRAYTTPDPEELFVPRGSVGHQSRAALRRFCRWAYLNQIEGLDLDLGEAVRDELRLGSNGERLRAPAGSVAEAIRRRDEFAAAVLRAGLRHGLTKLQASDLLRDVEGQCWLVIDISTGRRGQLARGGWLAEVTPQLYAPVLRSRFRLHGECSGEALLLEASGKPATAQALHAGVRRLGREEQLGVMSARNYQLQPLHGLGERARNLLALQLENRGLNYRQLERRCSVPSGFWWAVLRRQRESTISAGVLARAACELGIGVERLLELAGVDVSDLARVEPNTAERRLTMSIPDCW